MKKNQWYVFGAKVIAFIILVFALDIIIGKAFDKLEKSRYAKDPKLIPTKYMVSDLESEVVIVGASTASCHYIPSIMEDSLSMSVFNCGFDGTPFIVQNALLNLMLDRYNPKLIIWEMEGLELEEDHNLQFVQYLYPYYDQSSQVREVVNSKDYYQKYRMLSKTYRHNSKLLTEVKDLFSTGPRDAQLTLKGYKPLITSGNKYPTRIHKWYGNTLDSTYLASLETTIDRCQKAGIPLVFSTSPRYINDYEEIKNSPSYSNIVSISKKYNIPHLDYFELFSNDSTQFYDNAHLNANGAQNYMSVFIPALKEIIDN